MAITTISPTELAARHNHGDVSDLIDVRTPAEFRELHVAFARNVPLDRLDPHALKMARNGATPQPLYVICRSGNRATRACEQLVAAGCTNVINVEGGTLAWEQAGLPVARGQKTISLERQVRIVIGLIVLTGSVLSWFANPYWIGLTAFMGAGLIFSGIADFCGLALILGRMPWNQVSEPTPSPVVCSLKGPAKSGES